MLISLSSVGFSYDGNKIFDGVTFSVNEADRIGLVGENGAGKTTLIKLILGELYPDNGEITKKGGLKIGYLEQNGGYESGNTVYGEMREVFADEYSAVEKLAQLSSELAACEYLSKEYSTLSSRIESLNKFVASRDCYNIDVRIKTVLNGMGFAQFYDRKIGTMSGGEKTRLKLARLLLENPDLLILDEPTNHLDVKTLYWLEGYLSTFKGAIFVVSHDRYFLDRIIAQTAEIENKKFFVYRGNYSKYKTLKKEKYERELKEYEAQQEEIKKLQTYVDKNIVRATTAKSAQSRVKQLEKMEILEKPFTPPAPPRFNFTYNQRPAEQIADISNFNLEIGGKSLIVGGLLQIKRGDKIAIVGENGAGKSTFLRALTGEKHENITLGRYVAFAYYEQENANLNGDNTVLEELWGRHVTYTQTQARASLARCGLFPEDIDKKVSALSGGERAKLALCVFENCQGNVLVLDEPTNHLDLPARESLEQALCEFDGTVIFVSHDRYFISAVARRVVEIEDKKLNVYDGGYDCYKAQKDAQGAALREQEESKKREEFYAEKESSYRSKKERAEEAKRRGEIKSLETLIADAESEEERLNCMLSDPKTAADYQAMRAVTEQLQAVREKLDGLYSRYGEIID